MECEHELSFSDEDYEISCGMCKGCWLLWELELCEGDPFKGPSYFRFVSHRIESIKVYQVEDRYVELSGDGQVDETKSLPDFDDDNSFKFDS